MNLRIIAASIAVGACLSSGSSLMAAPASAAGAQSALPAIPPQVTENPIVQSVLQSLGGLLQTTGGNSAHGRVTFFERFNLQVQTAPNVYRDVHLHQGTVIDPRGTTIRTGMVVDVQGAAQKDGSLNADSIITH